MREITIACTIIFAFIIAVATNAAYWPQYFACQNIHRLTGLETEVTFSLGCMVKYRGEWVDGDVVIKHKQEVTIK